MGSELIHAIRTEIERVEAELDKLKAALKHCEQSGHWDMEVRMRSLRIRLDELYQNLRAAIEAYNPPA
jgi:chaperonin cofactor prefoldin